MAEETNEERIERELDRRIAGYRKGAPLSNGPTPMDTQAANVLEHFRNSVVRPLANQIREWRRAEQEIPKG